MPRGSCTRRSRRARKFVLYVSSAASCRSRYSRASAPMANDDASELTLGATVTAYEGTYEGGGEAGVRSRSPRGGSWLGGLALSKAT